MPSRKGAVVAVETHTDPFIASAVVSTPRGPRDELMMPMCISCTGANSIVPFAHAPATDGAMTVRVGGPPGVADGVLVTQFGVTRRVMRSGTACSRYACLSPMDAELSMSKRRSTLLIKLVF